MHVFRQNRGQQHHGYQLRRAAAKADPYLQENVRRVAVGQRKNGMRGSGLSRKNAMGVILAAFLLFVFRNDDIRPKRVSAQGSWFYRLLVVVVPGSGRLNRRG